MEHIQRCIAEMKHSTRVGERKAAAERLDNILSQEEDLVMKLNCNSVITDKRAGDKITWNVLFTEVRGFYEKESEKGNPTLPVRLLYVGLVRKVFEKATCNVPLLAWTKIYDFLITFLHRDRHAQLYGTELMVMLQRFLEIDLYRSSLEAAAYVALIQAMLHCYERRHVSLGSVLTCLKLCIVGGSQYDLVINCMRSRVVNFYAHQVQTNFTNVQQHSLSYLQGITELCTQYALEFRGTLCNFGETVIPYIIQIPFNEEEDAAFVEFLLLQFSLHMPHDCDMNSKAFHAGDHAKWKEALRQMYSYCIDAIEDRGRKTSPVDGVMSERFLLLAAKCTKQISSPFMIENDSSDDEDANVHAKKKMRYKSFNTIICDIYRRPLTEGLTAWMSYITAVLKHFPELIENKMNLANLMQLGGSIFNTRYMVRREFYEFFSSLLEAEKYLRKKGSISEANDMWSTVWDLTIKCIPVCEGKQAAVGLLRKILKELRPANLTSLLLQYVNNYMPLEQCSVELLAEYLSCATLPLQMNDSNVINNSFVNESVIVTACPRVALIRWLMSVSNSNISGLEPLVAAIMCSLVVKQTDVLINREIRLVTESEDTQFDFEERLFQACFAKLPDADKIKTVTESHLQVEPLTELNFIVLQRSAERLADAIKMDFDNIPGIQQNDRRSRLAFSHKCFVSKVSLYLNILNIMEKFSIGELSTQGSQIGYKAILEKVFDSGMEKCCQYIRDRLHPDLSPGGYPESVASVIDRTRKLFSNRNLSERMCKSLSQKLESVLEIIKRVFRSHLPNYIRGAINNMQDTMFFAEDLPSNVRMLDGGAYLYDKPEELYLTTKHDVRYETMSLAALNFLIDYGLICDHKVTHFSELVKDLLAERPASANLYHFEAAHLLITETAQILGIREHEELTGCVIELLQKLCRGYHAMSYCAAKIWKAFEVVTPEVSKYGGTNRERLMILFGTSSKLLETNAKVSKEIYINAFKAMAELARHDRGLEWSYLSVQKEKIWILDDLPKFLTNKLQEIRQLTADTICCMFENALPFDYSDGIADSQNNGENTADSVMYQERRRVFLEAVFKAVVNTFEVDMDLTPEEVKDEAVNRTSLALSLLTRLIFAFPHSQKQNIINLLVLVKIKGIDVQLAQRALEYASPNSTKTMCFYLPYILAKNLKINRTIDDLPYQFFGCETKNAFISKFRHEICVLYFEENKEEELEDLAQRLNTPPKELIKQSYGSILARLTPGLAIPGPESEKSEDVYGSLISTMGENNPMYRILANYVHDVVFSLFSLTFEPSLVNTWGYPEIKMAEPVPPHYPEATITACLEHLKKSCPMRNMSVLGFLARTSHPNIYDILETFIVRIHDAHNQLQKFWRLHQFSFFIDKLLKEQEDVFLTYIDYLSSFVFYEYLRLLKTECNSQDPESLVFLKVVIELITKFVTQLLDEWNSDQVKKYFTPVVRGVIAVVVKHPDLAQTAQPLLDYLLRKKASMFEEKIVSLDPFPSNIPEFHEFNKIHMELKYGNRRSDWSLSREMERFLEGIDRDAIRGACTKERLRFLRELLTKRKRDLDRMVKSIESRRFSEECESEPLHMVIKVLTDIACSSTRDEELAIEACKCLGEIGPVDLSVLVLPPYKSQGKITSREDAMKAILDMVYDYVCSTDIVLVQVAGKVLRSIFQFEECANIINSCLENELPKLLLPFRCLKIDLINSSIERMDANKLESRLALNEMDEGIDYKSWLTQLIVGVIECFRGTSSIVTSLLPLCELRLDFCENIFPFVIYLALSGGRTNPLVRKSISGYFRNFFSKFVANYLNNAENVRSITPSSSGTSSSVIYMNKLALRLLMRVVQFLRRHPVPHDYKGSVKTTPFDNNFWIDLNYLDVARAAQYCGAYLTSILYTEISATELDTIRPYAHYPDDVGEEDSPDQFYSQGASMYPQNRSEASKMEKLLLKAYSNLGEEDAAFGCGSARFAEGNVHHIEQTMDWSKLLMISNGTSVNKDSCSDPHVAQSFKGLGVYNVLWTYLKGVESQNQVIPEELQQAQFECGWRLSQWNLNTDKPAYIKECVDVPSHAAFQMNIYETVQAALTRDTEKHVAALRNGYNSVFTELRHATLESSVNLYSFLSKLQMLRVVEDFVGSQDESGNVDIPSFLGKWKLQDRIPVGDFKFQEPALYLRNVLLRAYDISNVGADLESEITESLLGLISKAREASNLDYADTSAIALASIVSKPCLAREFEVAKIKWARGKPDNRDALFIMNQLLKKAVHDDDLYPALLLRHGEWLSETLCERPTVILEKYLQRACSLYEKKSSSPNYQQEISKAYIVLAKYADAQYQNVTKYMASDVFQAKLEHVQRTQASKHLHDLDKNMKKNAQIMMMHSSNDDDEIKSIQQEQKKFLILALRHYLKGLKTSNENDLLIFRAISLWLENGNDKDDDLIEETTRIFNDETLPSFKYIVVLHQLSARLSNKSSMMNDLLKQILLKCAEDHPYHALPVLLTQANLHKDENVQIKKNSGMKLQLAGRVQAASDIVQSLRINPLLKLLVSKMESLWLALIHLANISDGSRNQDGVKKHIPGDIHKQLNALDQMVAVPTANIPVLSSRNYKESIVGISAFGRDYALVGGINSPKKITCRGTNGMIYNMLLKGQDDLRQDAVMQQVFGVMNKLLQVEQKTKMRRLQIRTYRVIPLSQRTGIIEWIENTQTLGEYLTGQYQPELGAHVRYRPNDYKPMDCRRLMQEARNKGDAELRYTTYINICEHFKPVFRHFFFENFKEAGVFFEKRLAYTRSVATNSIVGYILGLGDRHVLNILIDKTTAELVHIDLGVAFEQGRILPTPETIPFRLTRDIVDGMGMSGPEGVFRKSSEMTMEVLRKNSDVIITVLQVLLYDPLYMWTLSSDRVARVQPSDFSKGGRNKQKSAAEQAEESANERNNAASRVLLRLRQKLMGIEEEGGQTGAMSSGQSISIEGHVSLLIQRAMDPEKLCKLFAGWQPYL